MFDPQSERDVSRLREAIDWSEEKLIEYREQNVRLIKQYIGFHCGEHGAPDKVPVNMMELGINIFQQRICPDEVQALVNAQAQLLAPGAADLELAVNHQARQIDITSSFAAAGLNAMFSLGILKSGVDDEGEFFADPVLTEDFFWDMTSRSRKRLAFMGDRFFVPLEWAQNNPDFDEHERSRLGPETPGDARASGRGDAETRSGAISEGDGPLIDEFEDRVELLECWLPRERMMLTMAANMEGLPLKITSRPRGTPDPYDWLGFGDIPGNVMQLAPARLWLDLHEITNRLFNKVGRQAERQKTMLFVQGHAAADGSRVVDGNDGDALFVENPDGIQEHSTGGPNQTTLAMILWTKQMLSYLGGNWDALGGLGAQSGTVGQDKLLSESSSERIKDMQRRMYDFVKRVMHKMAWYLWNDPLIQLPLSRPIPGTPYSVPFMFTPERRMGEFFDYNFTIDPYSLTVRSPEEKAGQVTQFVTNILLPVMPLLAEAGIGVKWEEFFKLLARYTQTPELNTIIQYMAGETIPPRGVIGGDGGGEAPGMPAATTRTYERLNRPAGTRQGQEQALMSSLLGSSKQPAEMAGLLRPAG